MYSCDCCYLVGGAVRDLLLQRQRDYLDLDFVIVKDAVKIAKKIANNYEGGFVLLDKERQIARVVFGLCLAVLLLIPHKLSEAFQI